MRRSSNVVLAAIGLLVALMTGCAVGQLDPEDAQGTNDASMSADVRSADATTYDSLVSDSRSDTPTNSDAPLRRESGPDALTSDVPVSSDVQVDVPVAMDVPASMDVPVIVDVPMPMDTFIPPDDPMTVDVPIPVDVGSGGGPGAICTMDTSCTSGGANCCANLSGLHVCGCRLLGSCNPIFCM